MERAPTLLLLLSPSVTPSWISARALMTKGDSRTLMPFLQTRALSCTRELLSVLPLRVASADPTRVRSSQVLPLCESGDSSTSSLIAVDLQSALLARS